MKTTATFGHAGTARAPVTLPALRLVSSSHGVRLLARGLKLLLVLLPLGLAYVPWQQTVHGYGRVIAFNPTERPQTLQAPISGRVKHVWVIEGQHVSKGQPLIELEDNDPQLIDNLMRQRSAIQMKLEFAQAKVKVYQQQVQEYIAAREAALSKADSEIRAAEQKVRASQQGLEEKEAEFDQAKLSYERIKKLHKEGLASTNDLELAVRKFEVEKRKVEQSRAYLSADQSDLQGKIADRTKVDREANAKIESARASENEAQGDVSITDKELTSLEITINRQDQIIMAPRDGTVHKIWVNNNAEILKAGDRLVTIVPDTDARAVELFVSGNDASLVQSMALNTQKYDEVSDTVQLVRLQFEGWPAVQFSGWPSVAVGTFGGRVAVVDPTDDGKGKFRIVIVPHKGPNDIDWPSAKFLRQGVRANGWVMLKQVPLGWEVWRRLNGFPPVVAEKDPDEKEVKLPKVPK